MILRSKLYLLFIVGVPILLNACGGLTPQDAREASKLSVQSQLSGAYKDFACDDLMVLLDLLESEWIYPLRIGQNPRNITRRDVIEAAYKWTANHFNSDHGLSTSAWEQAHADAAAINNVCESFLKLEEMVAKADAEATRSHFYEHALVNALFYLDPHSYIESPTVSEEGRSLGLRFAVERNHALGLKIVNIDATSPAGLQGDLQVGDRISTVKIIEPNQSSDDALTTELNSIEAKIAMQERLDDLVEGTNVVLTVKREKTGSGDKVQSDEIFSVEMKVLAYQKPEVFQQVFKTDGGLNIGYIQISAFENDSDAQFYWALEQISRKQSTWDGLILDLRNNRGGSVRTVLNTLSSFWKNNVIARWRLFRAVPDTDVGVFDFFASIYPESPSLSWKYSQVTQPTLVLVNQRTASAAEFFPAALMDQNQVLIIGETTYGKGTGQKIFSLMNLGIHAEGRVMITNQFIYSPLGNSFHVTGVTPDILLEDVYGAQARQTFPQRVHREIEWENPDKADWSDVPQHYALRAPDFSSELREEADARTRSMGFSWLNPQPFEFGHFKSKDEIKDLFTQVLAATYEQSEGQVSGDPMIDVALEVFNTAFGQPLNLVWVNK